MFDKNKTSKELHEEMGKIARGEKPDAPAGDQNPPEVPDKPQKSDRIHTWVEVDDDVYTSAGRTSSELPPGAYMLMDHQGSIAFRKTDLSPEQNLIRGENTFIDQSLQEIDQFWEQDVKDIYSKYGYLHKRGYLFYGKHGCGKTSITMTAIHDFLQRFNGYVIMPFNFPEYLNGAIKMLSKAHPDRPIICYLEDLETITRNEENQQHISNLLDGGHNVDNILFLATTNHPEKLDPKFLRARRFDKIIRVPPPEEKMRREYLKSLRQDDTDISDDKIEEIVRKTDGYTFSSLSELFISCICLGNNVDDILKRLEMIERGKFETDEQKIGLGN